MGKQRWTRRRYLRVLGTGSAGGLAGCSGVDPSNLFGGGIDEAARERYVGVATRTAAEVTEWDRARRRTTRRLAQTDVAQNGTSDERQDWLQAEAGEFAGDVYQVHVVEPGDSWTVVASTRAAKVDEPLNTNVAPWQIDNIEYGEDGVFTSRAVEALTRSLVSFVTLLGPDEDRLLVVQTDMDAVANTFQRPAGEGYSQLVNGDGRVVAGTRETERLDRNDGSLPVYPAAAESQALSEALGGKSGFVAEPAINERDETDDETAYVVAYAPVETRAWGVLTHVPKATAKNR